jgi:hypothetical protein
VNVELPDGTTVEGIPDGTTKEQLASKLTAKGFKVPTEWMAKSEPKALQSKMGKALEEVKGFTGVGDLGKAGGELGSKVVEGGTKLGLPPEVTALGATIADVGLKDVAPMAAGGGIGGLAKTVAPKVAESLMSSALKPSVNMAKSGEAATAIRTMLDEGISVTKGGVRKLQGKINDLNDEIKDAISKSTATVNKAKVAGYLTDKINELKQGLLRGDDVAVLKKQFNEFFSGSGLPSEIPVQQAQKLKQSAYRDIGENPYQKLSNPTGTEGKMTIARGLKEGIAEKVPEIAGLNAQESKLLTTLKPLEKRVLVEANKNPGGLVWLAHNPAAATAYLADKSSALKSILARMIEQAGKGSKSVAAGAGLGGSVGELQQQSLRNGS